jgi:sulfopyruvate decarboxylase alpha subunit
LADREILEGLDDVALSAPLWARPNAAQELRHSDRLVNEVQGPMSSSEMSGVADAPAPPRAWHETVRDTLKRNEVRLAVYVPDNVLTPVIRGLHADPFFTTFTATREEEAVGIVSGAAMAGMRGIVLMQTSGFATLANVLASLPVVFQIPVLMMVSERGTLGEFNLGQAMVARTMRPVLDALAIAHHTLTREDEVEFIVDRTIRQAMATRAPACLILSPLLTGGKVFGK